MKSCTGGAAGRLASPMVMSRLPIRKDACDAISWVFMSAYLPQTFSDALGDLSGQKKNFISFWDFQAENRV